LLNSKNKKGKQRKTRGAAGAAKEKEGRTTEREWKKEESEKHETTVIAHN